MYTCIIYSKNVLNGLGCIVVRMLASHVKVIEFDCLIIQIQIQINCKHHSELNPFYILYSVSRL